MNKKKIIYKIETEIDQSFVEQILEYITTKACSIPSQKCTFVGIMKGMKLNSKGDHKKLRIYLMYMEDEKLIEERHFMDGVVDYNPENKGIEIMNKKGIVFTPVYD